MSESRKKEPTSDGDQQSVKKKKKAVTRVGDFELKKKLGKGGMGEVYLAKQVSLDRTVALKTLSRELAKKEDFVARFLREARSMAKLDHVNVVKVYAVDSLKGLHFVAIEYVDGRSIQDWLDKLTKFSIGDSVHIAMVSAQGMKHAHDQNMVHRDIKPDNILLTRTGIVKVADFGLAKVMDDDVSMTQSGTDWEHRCTWLRNRLAVRKRSTSAVTFTRWASCSITCSQVSCRTEVILLLS